jgi:arylsulfatase A-like enzyme
VLGVFGAWGRRRPDAAVEPFTALFTPPGAVAAEQANAANAALRREYASALPPGAGGARRNVIVIFADALRADHMGVYGYARATTPFLSRLDSAGSLRKVTLALATCPFTACGVVSTLASRDSAVLELGSLKIQDVLHDRGYRTYFIGASDHTVWYTLRLHYGDNVDYFFDGFRSKRYSLNDDRLVLEGLEGVPASSGTPAFFSFFLTSTHVIGTKLPEFRRWTPATGVNAYDNGILQADRSIEQILSTLDTKGYLAGSIVVILGDHGDAFEEHGITGHTLSVYQETLHIPLLFMDADSSGRYANLDFATQSDVAPTILERLGLPSPASWQGQSLVSGAPRTMSTHWTDRARPWHAVVYRTGGKTYKYMYVTQWARLKEELYELGSDPLETRNLIAMPGLDEVRRRVRGRAAARWP